MFKIEIVYQKMYQAYQIYKKYCIFGLRSLE